VNDIICSRSFVTIKQIKRILNQIKTDHLFEGIKIEVKNSDKMTEVQMQLFVTDYFK